MKKILIKIAYILPVLALIFLMAFSKKSHDSRTCPEVSIDIDYGKREFATDVMLISQEIENILRLHFDSIKGKKLEKIVLENIKETLSTHAYVDDIEVYEEVNGKINIHLTQRRPIVRVYGHTGNSFYLDEEGSAIPVKAGFPARVLIASGSIDDRAYRGEVLHILEPSSDSLPGIEQLRNIWAMAKTIDQDNFLRKEITQIDLESHQINLIPLVGRHVVVMRTFNDYERKLRKLKIFYKQGLSKGGWDRYRTINIEFKNQVVCTKI